MSFELTWGEKAQILAHLCLWVWQRSDCSLYI